MPRCIPLANPSHTKTATETDTHTDGQTPIHTHAPFLFLPLMYVHKIIFHHDCLLQGLKIVICMAQCTLSLIQVPSPKQ